MTDSIDVNTGLVDRADPEPFPFGPRSVAEILDRSVDLTPDVTALIDGERSWSYKQLDDAVSNAAGALSSVGVDRGTRVAWSMSNCAELPIGFLACQRLGAIWLGINPNLVGTERRYLLDDADVTTFIAASPDRLDHAPSARGQLALEEFGRLMAQQLDPPRIEIDPHAPAAIAYTSGTTGRPKGAVHSQHNLLWHGLASIAANPRSTFEKLGTPLSHTILNMMVLGPITAFVRGSTSVILRRTDADGFAHDVESLALTYALVVPTIVHDLVESSTVGSEALSSLEHVIIGGAGTPPAIRSAFHRKYGVRPIISYGLSEAPSGVARESVDDPINELATGRPLVPVRIVIVDDNDAPIATHVDGEICVAATTSGPWANTWTPMLGYWRRPDDTAAALRGGLLHTGDIGSLDSEGRLRVSGRRSELIIRGGANVYPAEVEQVLVEHPSIGEAAVLGIADPRLGQRVAAVVTLTDPATSTGPIRDFCAERLARYKIPDIIVVTDCLPRNAMGKVQKNRLIELATTDAAGLIADQQRES